MQNPDLSENEAAKYKKLKKAHDDKVEQYLKENPDANKSLVLSSVYGTLRNFIVAHREALSTMVVVKSANQSTSNLTSGRGIPLDADALNMVADELNNGTVMLGNGAPSGRDRDSDNGTRRKKKSDALNGNGTMLPNVVDFVNAADKLASVLHAVTAAKKDVPKSHGKSKGKTNDNKMVAHGIASKMKAFGFGAPKALCDRDDLGKKLREDPDAKKQVIMFPWINGGEFKDLNESELKAWAIKLNITTEEEYQQMCDEVLRTSMEQGGSKSFHLYNYGTLFHQLRDSGDRNPSSIINSIKDFCKRRDEKTPDEAMVFLSKVFHDAKGSDTGTKSGAKEDNELEDEQQNSSSSSGQSSGKSGNGTSKSSGESSGTISGSSSVSALTETSTSSNDEWAQKIKYEQLKFENLKIQQELASGKSGAKGAEDSKPGALEKTKAVLNDIDLTNPEVQKLMNAKLAEIQELTRAKNLAGQRASLAGGGN